MEDQLENLIRRLAKLPGFGPRSARRAVLHMLERREMLMLPLAQDLARVAQEVRKCVTCGNLDHRETCRICLDQRRDRTLVCVVEDVGGLWALERADVYSGLYHVLGGTLSAIDGRGPEQINMDKLVERVRGGVAEVILALPATVDGQTTAHYIHERLGGGVAVTRLARGVPVGGEIDYLDDGTLAQALKARARVADG